MLRKRSSGERLTKKIARLSEVLDMAEVKFAKGSEEWQMFMDFWALCQKYWEPEKTDEWWEKALHDIDVFSKNYGSTVFVRGLCLALVRELEVKHVSIKN